MACFACGDSVGEGSICLRKISSSSQIEHAELIDRKYLWVKLIFSHYIESGIKISLHRNTKLFSKTYMEVNPMFGERSLYLK